MPTQRFSIFLIASYALLSLLMLSRVQLTLVKTSFHDAISTNNPLTATTAHSKNVELVGQIGSSTNNPPLAVELHYFRGSWTNNVVTLEWLSGSESDIAGFYVWRSETNLTIDASGQIDTSQASKLNESPIVADSPCSASGFDYNFADDVTGATVNTYYYYIEAIKCLGNKTEFYNDGTDGGLEITGSSSQTPTVSVTPTSTPTATITPTNTPTLYHPAFMKNYLGINHTLYLQNPADSAAAVTLIFADDSGATYSLNETIPAKGTLKLPADNVPGLADGFYSLLASSDQAVQSVIHEHRLDGDKLALYRGISSDEILKRQHFDPQGAFVRYFGPFYGSENLFRSGLLLLNIGNGAANITVDALDTNGSAAASEAVTVALGSRFTFVGGGLPADFVGWVRVSSDQPLVGLLAQFSGFNDFRQYQHSSGVGTNVDFIPRIFKGVDEGGGPRTTTLFVGNTSDNTANVTLSYYTDDGSVSLTESFTVLPQGATLVNPNDQTLLPDGNLWAVVMSSDQPVVFDEVTRYDSATTYSSGTYGSQISTEISLPRLAHTSQAYSIFSLQNTGASEATVSIDYYDLSGNLLLTQSEIRLSPGGWVRYNQSQMSALGSSFEGSAIITSDQPLRAWVDEYLIDTTLTPTPTPTTNSAKTPTPTNTRTATRTPTPTNTRTPTGTPTPTNTPALTPTPTQTPDAETPYEPNDTCSQAWSIPTDGTIQAHTFHQQVDEDWVRFDGTAGVTYLIEARVPDDSRADVALQLYDACGGSSTLYDSFGPTVRVQFDAISSGPHYMHLTNYDPDATGADVNYQLSVRALNNEPTPGALVLVAGRLRANDRLQPNIHQVTNQVYRLFLQHGYTPDRIYYLATDSNLDADNNPATQDVDALANRERLEYAITEWATDESLGLGADRAFTLYMIDHGDYDTLYLNTSAQQVGPDDLDGWLSTLENAAPGVKVNVIVDASFSGSFIDPTLSLSKPGRVVIASTTNSTNAYASSEGGAIFSDTFVQALDQNMSLYSAFEEAQEVAQSWHPDQVAWLDDNGDGQANGSADGEVAQQRGFAYAGSFADEQEPPYIAWAKGPTTIDNRRGQIEAHVQDDVPNSTLNVWAVIYDPSYTPPPPGQEIVLEENLPTIRLQDPDGDNVYSGEFAGFDQMGSYRIVVYAVDENGLQSRPRATVLQTGYELYLPAITR
ncbi:MAG: hypothetical protein ACPGWR_23045 [Ardenticatenaceae bacterium]